MGKIKWLEWNPETFAFAKKQNKPILLDIHGVWCHWCHVMDEGTYSDDLVIELMDKFIPVKVDTDERPDINDRYNQGGWPTTVALTSDGKIIAGATYLPPVEMAMFLDRAFEHYKHGRGTEIIHDQKPEKSSVKHITDDVAHEIAVMFDSEYGGFGVQPKFPFPDAIELLFLQYRKTKNDKWLNMARKTLDGMLRIFDSIEGGFYRYSVTREWTIPHYEKMMESNAQLIENYLHASQITGDDKYRKVAEKTADYIISNLLGAEGFYSSQDAGPESEYYEKSLDEREAMKKPYIDKNVYTNLNGLAISAFIALGGMYRRTALKMLERLLASNFDGKLMRHSSGNNLHFLSDNVNFARALMDAYEATANKAYIEKAKIIIDNTIKEFFDHGFNDILVSGKDKTGLLNIANRNIMQNASAAECLIRLSFYTENDSYRKKAEEALSYFAEHAKQLRIHAASYALAVEILLDGIGITLKDAATVEVPYDPRIIIKYDNTIEKILLCRGMKCMAFDDALDMEKEINK